jgi:drug/metabolite transporter (DMT)-like permease
MPHLLLYFLALACLSTAPNWAKLNQMPAEVLGFWRLTIAASLLVIYQVFYKKQALKQSKASLKWIVISGVLFFLHLWTYKYAAKHTLVSITMILFATTPLWTAIFNIFAFKERIQARTLVSFFIAFLGVFLLAKDQFNSASQNSTGNLSALISAVLCALYLITGKKARLHVSNLNFASLQYSVCAFCFLVATLFTQADFFEGYTQISWYSVLGLVALPTLLGHFLFSYLMQHMNLAVMTCGKLIEPVLASLTAVLLFQENITAMTFVAFTLTSLAILNLFWPQIKHYAR